MLATRYGAEPGSLWEWEGQPQDNDAIAGLAFAEVPLRITSDIGDEVLAVGDVAFLHPHRRTKVEALGAGTGVCVCVPWNSLREVEDGVQAPAQILASTPLAAGMLAFVTSLLTQQEPPTLYTDYLVERVVVEMAFGVLLESAPRSALGSREERPVDRARSLMLLRRSEAEFGVAELARELHMSTRHVQRLFAAENSSPADELRGMRLELARELLGDSTYDSLSVGDVAEHAGFKTAAAMRRAFTSRDLPMPSRARRSRALVA